MCTTHCSTFLKEANFDTIVKVAEFHLLLSIHLFVQSYFFTILNSGLGQASYWHFTSVHSGTGSSNSENSIFSVAKFIKVMYLCRLLLYLDWFFDFLCLALVYYGYLFMVLY